SPTSGWAPPSSVSDPVEDSFPSARSRLRLGFKFLQAPPFPSLKPRNDPIDQLFGGFRPARVAKNKTSLRQSGRHDPAAFQDEFGFRAQEKGPNLQRPARDGHGKFCPKR